MAKRAMSSVTISRHRGVVLACIGVALAAGGLWVWRQFAEPHRPRYVLINETGQHDYDRAFTMSLKLAEKKSGIENALVLLKSLPPSTTMEQTAAGLFRSFESAPGATAAAFFTCTARRKIC